MEILFLKFPVFLVAVPAIDRPAFFWLEGNFCFGTAI